MSIADFAGRKYDLLAFRGTAPAGPALLTPRLVTKTLPAEICVGLQKLSQRWLLELLTPLGSIPYQPDRGCSFLPDLLAGRGRTTSDVFAIFGLAELQIRTNLTGEETDADPSDERYRISRLLSVKLNPGALELTTELQSRSDSAQIIVPLPLAI